MSDGITSFDMNFEPVTPSDFQIKISLQYMYYYESIFCIYVGSINNYISRIV